MKKLIIKFFYTLLFSVISLVLFSQCKKTPIEPKKKDDETNCNYEPGNRNFTWRIDTVAWWPSDLGGIWAFADNDAYVMGNINQWKNGDMESYSGLHWNGNEWSTNISGGWDDVKHYSVDVTGDDYYMVSVGDLGPGSHTCGLAEFNNITKKWKGYQFQTEGTLYSVWTDKKGYYIAVGTNGMIYQKDGYAAEWVYSKAPTEFTFTKVTGISKNEIYLFADINLQSGNSFQQIWKYSNNMFIKLLDNQDTTNTYIKIPESAGNITDIAVNRCKLTDTLQLYIVGSESYLLKDYKDKYKFHRTNLSYFGLPLSYSNYGASRVFVFSPDDYWITGLKYNLFHWNGTDFYKTEPISSLPYGEFTGLVWKMQKNSSGKIWMLLENSSQVYTVLQGNP
ncbi:MAG: hypothetical protein GXX85_15355 [Ignavibacteria bacterium]|nr:hypothetical protein [Ignavibacteria bacterium]